MKRFLVFIITCIALMCNSEAQNMNEKLVKQKINSTAAGIKHLQCDFVQTKNMKMLNKKQTSKGKMWFSQPDRLRWEYVSPYRYVFILNGNKVFLKNDNRNDVIDVNRNKMFKEIARIMMYSVVGKCLSDDKSFKTYMSENANEWIASLTPLRKEMKSMFSKIILHFNKSKAMVSSVEMTEKNGDKTNIELINIRTNEPIPEKTYSAD